MTRNRFAFTRQVAGVFFVAFVIALACCFVPQRAVAEDEGGSLRAGGTSSGLAIQAEGDLQFVGLSGTSVTGSGTNPSGYTVYVRDGDTVDVTLKLKNSSGHGLEYVSMTDSTSYPATVEGEDNFTPIAFPPHRGNGEWAADAENMSQKWQTSETTAVGYPGYWIEADATPTFQLKISAGDLVPGTYNLTCQLGRVRWDYEKHLIVVDPTLSYEQWDFTGEEVEEVYSGQIPIKVVVYTQDGASLRVGQGTNFDPVQTELTSAGIDFGTINLETASEDQLTGRYDVNVINSGTPNVFTDSHDNSTSIKVAFDGENNGNEVQARDGAAFYMSNGTLYDTNWDPLPPATTSGNSTEFQTASYTVYYDVETLIAGTYTGNLIINTVPHKVKINGKAGDSTGVYKYPVKIVLTGTNPRLLPKATNVTASPGNGRVDLKWTPGEGADEYSEYTVYRREGAESQTDPDKLDWSLYEEVGTKTVGEPNDDGTVLFVDGTVNNGTTYSYTVICGKPYHGYAANTASAMPLASIQSPMLAPVADASGTVGCIKVSWKMHENYGGTGSDGAGMVDHFNIYRDGVLVDVVNQSAVNDDVSIYDPAGFHKYGWEVDEPVPELYTPYAWQVSAVSPSGVESDFSESVSAEAVGEPSQILTHDAWFDEALYDEETEQDRPAILIFADEYGHGDTLETINVWRNEGTTAPSTSGAPYAVADKYTAYASNRYDFADFNVSKGKTYTYTIQGVDGDANTTNFHTFTVKAVEETDFGSVKGDYAHPMWSVVDHGKKARLQWYCAYSFIDSGDGYDLVYNGTYKVYRNDTCIKTLSSADAADGLFDFYDNPGADGTYVYRVDKIISGVTVRGRDFVFHRNTQPVDPDTLLQPPDAPTLRGRTASDTGNVILSWTPSSTGGVPEGYHIYRSDAGQPVLGGRYLTGYNWQGSYEYFQRWGNNRYITLVGSDTMSFVDGRVGGTTSNYYKGDTHLGEITDLSWNDSNMPHEYYITAYNRAGESAPSPLVVFDTNQESEGGYPIAPITEADEAPEAPVLDKLWIDWDDSSSYRYGFDDTVYGYARVAWSDSELGGDIDSWTATWVGTHWDANNPPQYDSLQAPMAALYPETKRGVGDDAPKTMIDGYAGDSGDLGRTITATVSAKNSMGETISNELSLVVRGIPRFYALPDNGGSLLRWTDLTEGDDAEVTSWEIWRKAEYGIWEKQATLPSTTPYAGTSTTYNHQEVKYYEWADSDLDNGWTYEYKIVAKCDDDNDRESVVRDVTPTGASAVEAPGAPQNLRAVMQNGVVCLNWDKPATGGAVGEYNICKDYDFKVSGDTARLWQGLSWVNGNSTSYAWAPSEPGTYHLLVYSTSTIDGDDVPDTLSPYQVDPDGWTTWTFEDALSYTDKMYPTHSNIITVTITQADIDSQPTGSLGDFDLALTPGDGQVTVSWTASDNAVIYEVERFNTNYPKMPDVKVAAIEGQQSYTYVDTTAEPGVKYRYVVSARGVVGGGLYRDGYATAGGKTRDEIAATRVADLIEGLPSVAEIEAVEYPSDEFARYERQVAAVQEAYDGLSAKQKALVSADTVKKLQDVATALVACKYAAEVRPVQDGIDALPSAESIAAASEGELDGIASQITAARNAYNALPTEAKPGVNTSRLEAAEQALAAARKAYADKAAAKAVDDLIDAIPSLSDLALADGGDVAAAREAYAALTVSQQQHVSKLSVLEAAEARIAALQKVEDVKQAILALKPADELSLSDLDAVSTAHGAYEALPQEDKPFVGDELADKLQRCWEKIKDLIAADPGFAAKRIDDLIEAIGEVTPDKADAVAGARSAYEALSSEAQALVTKLSVLEAAEQTLADFEAAAKIDGIISALPSFPTLDDADRVAAARDAYDGASPSVQAKVTKLSDLEAAEDRVAELREAARVDISKPFGALTLSATSFTYNGADHCPGATVRVNGEKLVLGRDYDVYYANNRNAGRATVTVLGIGNYKGMLTGTFTIKRAANPLSAKAKTLKVKYKKLKKKAQKVAALAVSGVQGKVAYKIVKIKAKKKLAKQAKKKIKLAAGGKLALKKKLKKGTYKVTVRVSAIGDGNYLPASRDVTVKLRVK